jgi:hypothetical protein
MHIDELVRALGDLRLVLHKPQELGKRLRQRRSASRAAMQLLMAEALAQLVQLLLRTAVVP